MQLLYFLLVCWGASYFLTTRRYVDLFTVAFFSGIIYFMPALVGYVNDPTSKYDPIPLEAESYLVMMAVMGAIFGAAVISDLFDRDEHRRSLRPQFELTSADRMATYFVLCLAIVGFGLTVLTVGATLLSPNKQEVIDAVGRWRVFWVSGSALAAVFAISMRQKWPFIVAMLLLFGDVYVGFRSTTAVTFIAISVLVMGSKGKRRVFSSNWRAGLVTLCIGFAFFVYKFLYQAVKYGDYEQVQERLADSEFYLETVLRSEPFTTQTILNEVLLHDFQLGLDHLVKQLFLCFTAFGNNLFSGDVSFNSMYQDVLFPSVNYGMAANIWAQMISVGGWLGLLMFISFYVYVLHVGSRMSRRVQGPWKAVIVLAGAYWAFYFHRNDLLYQSILEKRVFVIGALAILVPQVFLRRHALDQIIHGTPTRSHS